MANSVTTKYANMYYFKYDGDLCCSIAFDTEEEAKRCLEYDISTEIGWTISFNVEGGE